MSRNGARPAVLVIGDVMLDVVVAGHGPIEAGTDTPAAIAMLPGGSGANQAAWLGSLGHRVHFVGRAGADSIDWHAAELRRHGVEPLLARDESLRTGVLVNLVSSDGERSFLTDRGANARLSRDDLPDALLDGIGLIHVSAYALATPPARAAVLDYLGCAQARGIPISVDPASASLLRTLGTAAFLEWTRPACVCFPNAAEALLLAGSGAGDTLSALAAHYEVVVIKRGAAGAVASADRGARRLTAEAPRVTVVDSTGAGDAFVAGFLSAWLGGDGIAAALDAGVALGSSAVSAYGGRPPRVTA